MGVIAYADDLVLLAPNRSAAQNMLTTCEKFAEENNIKFSTHENPEKSKSKALYIVGHKNDPIKPAPLKLCGRMLPYVDQCDHLGHILNVKGTMDQDCLNKRADFIQNAVKIRETFNFAHPLEIINATEKYCSHFYGSNLYDLRGKSVNMLYASWNTNVKLVWNLPRATHTYFIPSILAPGVVHPRVYLMTRFLTFFHSLLESPSPEVQVMARLSARDKRTNVGSNLDHIRCETGLDPWLYGGERIRDCLVSSNQNYIPESDVWRVEYARKLLY